MLIAILSDIHSNLEALRSVLQSVDQTGTDEIWCLGDIVGYGPSPNECIDVIRERCTLVLKGNHDAGAIGEVDAGHFNVHGRAAIEWTRKEITKENKDYLRTLPLMRARRDITAAHASPARPDSWPYAVSWLDAEQAFKAFKTPVCFIGHTHIPLIVGEDRTLGNFRKGVRHLINVGSVGQPRDGNPKASYGLLDTDGWTYTSVRVAYDMQKVLEGVKRAGLPLQLGKRLFVGI